MYTPTTLEAPVPVPLSVRPPLCAALALAGCSPPPVQPVCDEASLSTCLAPTWGDDYYADQGQRYFDTLDSSADPDSEPTYSDLVARWEWPPWLLLTGYGRDLTLAVDEVVLAVYPTTTVPERDCRGFDVQPFARCRVTMDFDGASCPIYEEFTFNDQGEVTFVEAWSNLPGLFPGDDEDPWVEANDAARLSTRIPGLGNTTGLIDPGSAAMADAAVADEDVAEFVRHAEDFWGTWTETYEAAGDDLYARGCGW